MINTIMQIISDRLSDNLWPITGGATGGIIASAKAGSYEFLMWMQPFQWIETLSIIIIGAAIGWAIKRLLDYCFPKKKKG